MIGKTLNKYQVVSLLGEGGMGTVYLAEHMELHSHAAIKILKPELLQNKSMVARFQNEALAASAIKHPNIVNIIDVDHLPDGTPYLIMEYLIGESLAKRLQRSRPLPMPEAVDILRQTASALAAVHKKKIIHRDLKPENLFLVPDETMASGIRIKVLDFGIAKLNADTHGHPVQTQTGTVLGTPAYMSPEQCRGVPGTVDHRTDIYSIGIILYEMFCGRLPFTGEGPGDFILGHMSKTPPPLRKLVPQIPELVENAVMRALAREPEKRFASMDELVRAICEYDPGSAAAEQAGDQRSTREPNIGMASTLLVQKAKLRPVQVPSAASPAAVGVPPNSTPPPSSGLGVFVSKDKGISCGPGQITLNLRIDNRTSSSVDMSKVTLRYWYQDIGLGAALQLAANYVSIGYSTAGKVQAKAVATSGGLGADHYIELSFVGTLAAQGDKSTNDQFHVHVTLHTARWQGVVDVTKDYSYIAAKGYNAKITLHDNSGKVIWGVAPSTNPEDAHDAG